MRVRVGCRQTATAAGAYSFAGSVVCYPSCHDGAATLHIVVVGGGALGLSSALHLAERGVTVTVIEATSLAIGSTGRSIGVVGTQHVTPLDVAMRAYGLRRIRAWEQHGLD